MERSEALKSILERAQKTVKEIDQIFTDASYWNDYVGKPGEEKVQPDPDGELGKARISLCRFIEKYKPC